MNRPEKWLPGVSAASKVRAVARQTLAARLTRVIKNLKQAVKESDDQADRIHKLRTWCRRSTAAVELWRPLLPKKEAKWFAGKLKKIRQAAGDVRDLDVMLEQARENESLAWELNKQRDKALRPIARLHKRLDKRDKFHKRQRRLLKDIKEPKVRLGEWGTSRAGKQATALVKLGQRSLQSLEVAHEFRIACKELRYVLEIIGGALRPTATKLYELLGDLQQRIGVVCDQAAAEKMYLTLLAKVSRSHRQPFRDAASTAKMEKSRRHRAFLRWWSAQRRMAFHKAIADAGLLG